MSIFLIEKYQYFFLLLKKSQNFLSIIETYQFRPRIFVSVLKPNIFQILLLNRVVSLIFSFCRNCIGPNPTGPSFSLVIYWPNPFILGMKTNARKLVD